MAQRSILIVDDEAMIRLMLRRALEGRGYRVVEAGDGREGIEWASREDFDLVITDIFMPHEDGLGLIRHLREHCPGVQIIVMSAPSSSSSVDLAERMGAARVFSKPISLGDLLAAIAQLIGAGKDDSEA